MTPVLHITSSGTVPGAIFPHAAEFSNQQSRVQVSSALTAHTSSKVKTNPKPWKSILRINVEMDYKHMKKLPSVCAAIQKEHTDLQAASICFLTWTWRFCALDWEAPHSVVVSW